MTAHNPAARTTVGGHRPPLQRNTLASGINFPGWNVLLELLIAHHENTVFNLVFERVHRSGRRPFQDFAVGIKCALVTRTFEDSQILLPVIDGVVQMRTDSAENGDRLIGVTAEPNRPLDLLVKPAPVGRYRDQAGLELPNRKFPNVSHRQPFIDRAFPSKRKVTNGKRSSTREQPLAHLLERFSAVG